MKSSEKTGILLQARTGSQRLPQKMILPFYKEQSILQILLHRINTNIPEDIPFVVATSVNSGDDRIEELAQSLNVTVFRGSEDNVLLRFIEAAEKHDIKRIIRICGDNPFFDISGTLALLNEDPLGEFDYVGFKVQDNKPSILSHTGFWGEVVSLDALESVLRQTNEKKYLEHVTNYIYTHPEKFKIKLIEAPDKVGNRDDIRLTVDTIADFEMSRKIYTRLVEQNIPQIPSQIVNFIDQHPEYLKKMQDQIATNKK